MVTIPETVGWDKSTPRPVRYALEDFYRLRMIRKYLAEGELTFPPFWESDHFLAALVRNNGTTSDFNFCIKAGYCTEQDRPRFWDAQVAPVELILESERF